MNKIVKKLLYTALDPHPLRSATKWLIRRYQLGSYEQRVRLGCTERPHYGFCLYNAALLARKLGHTRISVLEFGVAGGKGLLNLEYHAREIKQTLNMDIEIYGFDSGEGLPEPTDYRDLPYHWQKGYYKMDLPKLESSMNSSKLVLGDIAESGRTFFEEYKPAPVGAIMFDFDFYSSTVAALKLLEADESRFLPRVFCYFDDVVGTEIPLYNDYTGERLAIHEFNARHDDRKLGIPYFLRAQTIREIWFHKIWIFHLFHHQKYNEFVSDEDRGNYDLL